MASIKSQKNPDKYFCESCNYETCSKKDFNKHNLTSKHQRLVNASKMLVDLSLKKFVCNCGKTYIHDSSYYRHKKSCSYKDLNNSSNIVKDNENNEIKQETTKNDFNFDKELMLMIINQNKELLEIVKNGTTNHSHNTTTHTNSHNKAFNLNFFLNETCKNAMNITDFVDSIKLQLSDLIEVGELGFVEGISKIILKNLNNLDETVRPVHCTDKKRETMYIKEEGEWQKDDDNKSKLKKTIDKVADKNIRLLPEFREKYPDYKDAHSRISDKYDKMMIQVMETDENKKEKIIHNISKATTIREK
jgi:hypothetical protein